MPSLLPGRWEKEPLAPAEHPILRKQLEEGNKQSCGKGKAKVSTKIMKKPAKASEVQAKHVEAEGGPYEDIIRALPEEAGPVGWQASAATP